MNNFLHPSVQGLLAVPPYPPRHVSLSEIAAGRRAGQIPPTATVQLAPEGPWLPVDHVLGQAGLLVGATPTRPLLVALVVVPPVLALFHHLVFKSGAVFLLLLWTGCAGLALVVSQSANLRSRTSKELIAEARQRPSMWRGMLAVAVVGELLAVGSGALRAVRKSRAESTFSATAPCTFVEQWDKLSEAELDTLEPEQISEGSSRRERCEEERKKSAAAEYAKQCEQIAGRMQARSLSDADRAHITKAIPGGDPAYLAGEAAVDLAGRISTRSLKASDLEGMKQLPCGPATRRAYLDAVASSPSAWTGITAGKQVGDDVLEGLGAQSKDQGSQAKPAEAKLSPETLEALHVTAEKAAKAMLTATTASDTEAAASLCSLERRLGGKPGGSCTGLAARAARLKAAELAAAKAANARCKAALAARQRCMRACDARQPQDELGMPAGDFDQSLDCYERCENAHPSSGCD